MIDFTRAFGSAWERMMVILFQPFDLGKWCAIGLSAFLAGLLSGGNGFNSFSGGDSQNQQNQHHTGIYHHHGGLFAQSSLPNPFNFGPSPQSLGTSATHMLSALQGGIAILIVTGIFIVIMGLVVLLYWLGSRGQFMFLDNIVRNRGSVAAPWSFYARPAHGVFLFYLACLGICMAAALVFIIPVALVMMSPSYMHFWTQGMALIALAFFGGIYLLLFVAFAIGIFFFREWSIALIFRNGLTVRAALAETWKLLCLHPGSAVLFLLLRFALWVALVILSLAACCFTCCVALLPYIGTVVLLPALVYIRCFSLDCLAQFGPAYDVFTVDLPSPDVPPNPASPLPPPV